VSPRNARLQYVLLAVLAVAFVGVAVVKTATLT